MNNPLRIGIAGLGTVGLGVIKILIENQKSINLKCGREIQIYCVSAKNKNIDRGLDISQIEWFDDPVEMASSDAIDVFVELVLYLIPHFLLYQHFLSDEMLSFYQDIF